MLINFDAKFFFSPHLISFFVTAKHMALVEEIITKWQTGPFAAKAHIIEISQETSQTETSPADPGSSLACHFPDTLAQIDFASLQSERRRHLAVFVGLSDQDDIIEKILSLELPYDLPAIGAVYLMQTPDCPVEGIEETPPFPPSLLKANIPFMGPNPLGLLSPHQHYHLSALSLSPRKGDIALVSSSTAFAYTMLDWADSQDIGFSHIVTLQEENDQSDMALDIAAILEILAHDPQTRAVILQIRHVQHGRRFMSAARLCSRLKPVIVLRFNEDLHNCTPVSLDQQPRPQSCFQQDAIYHAAFRRAGMIRATRMEELFDAAQTLSQHPSVTGSHLAIVSNVPAFSLMAYETVIKENGQSASLSPQGLEKLQQTPFAAQCRFPLGPQQAILDLPYHANAEEYDQALAILSKERAVDAILVIHSPAPMTPGLDIARKVATYHHKRKRPRLLTCWLGSHEAETANHLFHAEAIPSFSSPERAVHAFLHLVRHKRNQDELLQTPSAVHMDMSEQEQQALHRSFNELRQQAETDSPIPLTRFLSATLFETYDITVRKQQIAYTPPSVGHKSDRLDFAKSDYLMIKLILLPPLSGAEESEIDRFYLHYSDMDQPTDMQLLAETMLRRAEQEQNLKLENIQGQPKTYKFILQPAPMLSRNVPLQIELIRDPVFGALLALSEGGTLAQYHQNQPQNTILGLLPLNTALAEQIVKRTALTDYFQKDMPAAIPAIAKTIVKLSNIITDFPEISQMRINPIWVDNDKLLIEDAQIYLHAGPLPEPETRFAIREYPKDLSHPVTVFLPSKQDNQTDTPLPKNAAQFTCRPILPEDEQQITLMVENMDPDDVRMRFFAPLKTLSHHFAARLSQIDYDREMAFVTFAEIDHPDTQTACPAHIVGTVRLVLDSDRKTGEYAIALHRHFKGIGLGRTLMKRIIAYGAKLGLSEITGDVMAHNQPMLTLCRKLGFTIARSDDPEIRRVTLLLPS